MTKLNQIYRCNICGNIVEILHIGAESLVCCGQPMELLEEKATEEGNEKHLPVVEKTDVGIKVKVGSVPHPMEEFHSIEWIEIIADGKIYRKHLKPGDAPEAKFYPVRNKSPKEINVKQISNGVEIFTENIIAREYCNIHGLWKS